MIGGGLHNRVMGLAYHGAPWLGAPCCSMAILSRVALRSNQFAARRPMVKVMSESMSGHGKHLCVLSELGMQEQCF